MDGIVSRADLLRALDGADPARAARIGEMMGYVGAPRQESPQTPLATVSSQRTTTARLPAVAVAPPAPIPFWYPDSLTPRADDRPKPPPLQSIPVWTNAPTERPVLPLLSSWHDLQPRLRALIRTALPTAAIDIARVVNVVSRGRQLTEMPREYRHRLGPQLQVIVDRSDRLIPYWADQDVLTQCLSWLLPEHQLTFGMINEVLSEPSLEGSDRRPVSYHPPAAGGIVLVLGDLGCLDHASFTAMELWRRLGRRIAAAGAHPAALLPCPLARCPPDLQSLWHSLPWERTGGGGPATGPQDALSLRQRADRLMALSSAAVRLEPGLLRTIRRALPPGEADAGTESDVWQHAGLTSRHPAGARLDPAMAAAGRQRLADEPPEIQSAVLAAMQSWRHALPPEIWYEEVLNLPPSMRDHLPHRHDFATAVDFFRFLDEAPTRMPVRPSQLRAWLREFRTRATVNALSIPEVARPVETVMMHDPGYVSPPEVDPAWIEGGAERVLELRQHRDQLVPTGGSFIGTIRSSNLQVRLLLPNHDPFWADGKAPPWAEAWGRDAHGAWVSFSVSDPVGAPVEQRMRWIPSGSFTMGSPEDEPGRWPDEGPPHDVEIADGFWIFATPCTEALWSVVMQRSGDPVRGPSFPVTGVSWQDACAFVTRLNGLKPGLDLSLPSEACWEYACRAGTQTPYYFGTEADPTMVRFASSAPVPVGSLPPNPWGLHEMLGNVWEWCEDDWHDNYRGAPDDGTARVGRGKRAANRVVRGGSWLDDAGNVRAAYRGGSVPALRVDSLGFRCARVQRVSQRSGAAPAAWGAPADPAAERSAERREQPESAGAPHAAGARWGGDSGAVLPLPRAPSLIVQTDREELTLRRHVGVPAWASGLGRDPFGLYADFTIGSVTQRMRWIPPGQFMMGSPRNEPGRYDDEGPMHRVTIAKGFWLFDTPCTQALWEAVLGDNPSRFRSPTRPVEQVGFDDARRFIEALNSRVTDLSLTLPSEAQWEYACRAGTETATYAGPIEILDMNNAPILDAIAWYGGNSGVGFELDEGADSSGWSGKQYDHTKAGTHPVKGRLPNGWGLYDMLGNVWEWCADEWHDTYRRAPRDGSAWIGRRGGAADRVVRGGSWVDYAGFVRAAYRRRCVPALRFDDLGFRCARVQA